MEKNVREELMNKLINRKKKRHISLLLRLKIVLWEFTITLSYYLKRLFDIVASTIVIILFFPFLVIVSIMI
ncbi:MAG: hypothetical protein GQ534_00920 [Candidatus Delongbacteria bacterium]|nr:hypothetical protein [Candidatus Delongbacteria bacterium]